MSFSRIAAALACLLLLAGCASDETPPADPALQAQARDYVAAFNAAGEVMDAVEAAGAWSEIRDAKTFNTFANWDADPYTMRNYETTTDGVSWFCVHDTEADVYAASATGPTPEGEATHTVGFGAGTGCRHDVNAEVVFVLDDQAQYPLEHFGPLTDAVSLELDKTRAQLNDQSPALAVLDYAVRDLAAATDDLTGLGKAELSHAAIVKAGVDLPHGVVVASWTTRDGSVNMCLAHTAGAWQEAAGTSADDIETIDSGTDATDSCLTDRKG